MRKIESDCIKQKLSQLLMLIQFSGINIEKNSGPKGFNAVHNIFRFWIFVKACFFRVIGCSDEQLRGNRSGFGCQ